MSWLRFECFRDPIPVTRDYFLVSHAPADRFGLYVIDRYGNRELLYLDPDMGSMRPRPLRPVAAPPAIAAEERITEAEFGQFTVAELWSSSRVLRTKFSQVTILDGYAYGLSEGVLECVEVATGERVWKHGRYHHGQILRVHDLLLVMSEEGEMFLVEASPERRDNVLGSFQAIEGKTWNNFALYGPYLIVRNAREAAVFRLPLLD
jgi:hypothetical protein